ncbi:hypothetical protein KTH40_02825 [Acinetobacter haemolyticus]|uniref:hypothetical protein n=1 Tax=Acinetobacter haemolyticus TaxID=29430 RepID=UPI0021D0EE79|nr:hypothetical protein [Acinetobacter haemolyticus]MCU4386532.1 hypothetical protein [Acinetobacter haemolyticus]MCU4386541.1 hypothetical protein [Acinetobacter haemolyticus]
MKRIILWSLLTIASIQSHADEVTARVIFSKEYDRPISIITNTKEKTKHEKCIELIRSEEARKILKKQAEKEPQKLVKLKFTCNV